MPKLNRQYLTVRKPLAGVNFDTDPQDIGNEELSSVEGLKMDRGFVEKEFGRIPVGDTETTPLDGEIVHLASFRKLSGEQRLIAFTPTSVYTFRKGDDSWTNITGTASLNSSFVSSVTYVNKFYFTDQSTGGIFYWDMGDDSITALGSSQTCQVLAVYGERLLCLNTFEGGIWNRQRVHWSGLGVDTFSASNFVDLISYMGQDEIVAAAHLQSSLMLYGRQSICELSYTGASNAPFAPILRESEDGLAARRGLYATGTKHFFVSSDGIKVFDLTLTAKHIDDKVREYFSTEVDSDVYDYCVMGAYKERGSFTLYYPKNSNRADHMFSFQPQDGRWLHDSRGATAAVTADFSANLSIDDLEGTINSLSFTINALGASTKEILNFVGDENGTVWTEFSGFNLTSTTPVTFSMDTKDFNNAEAEDGLVWMSLEFSAKGDEVKTEISLDGGESWISLDTESSIDDMTGTINDLVGTISSLTNTTRLTTEWKRYRKDFEHIGKHARFRFRCGKKDTELAIRWFRIGYLPTASGGTLPT